LVQNVPWIVVTELFEKFPGTRKFIRINTKVRQQISFWISYAPFTYTSLLLTLQWRISTYRFTLALTHRVRGALSRRLKRPGREAEHSPPSTAEVKTCVELYFHSPNTPSWRGAQLKHRDNFTLPLQCLALLLLLFEVPVSIVNPLTSYLDYDLSCCSSVPSLLKIGHDRFTPFLLSSSILRNKTWIVTWSRPLLFQSTFFAMYQSFGANSGIVP
jgi:hypothetical protein